MDLGADFDPSGPSEPSERPEPSEPSEPSEISLSVGWGGKKPEEGRRPTTERPRVPASRVAFAGQLQMLAVPDLLDFLKSSRRTGTLVLTSDGGMGAVHLRNGMITSAASPNGTRLGKLLLDGGHVQEDQLAEVAMAQESEKPDRLLGGLLVSRGIVGEADVRAALERQVYSAVTELVQWTSGDFAFEPDRPHEETDQPPGVEEIDVEFDTQGVLLDVLRALDEQARGA